MLRQMVIMRMSLYSDHPNHSTSGPAGPIAKPFYEDNAKFWNQIHLQQSPAYQDWLFYWQWRLEQELRDQ